MPRQMMGAASERQEVRVLQGAQMREPMGSRGSGDGADPRPRRLQHGLGLPSHSGQAPRAVLRSSRASCPCEAPGSAWP